MEIPTYPSTSPPPMSEDCTSMSVTMSDGTIDSNDTAQQEEKHHETETAPINANMTADETAESSNVQDTSNNDVQAAPSPQRRSIFGHLSSENLRKADVDVQTEPEERADNPALDAVDGDVQLGEEPGKLNDGDGVRNDDAAAADQQQQAEEPMPSGDAEETPSLSTPAQEQQQQAAPTKEEKGGETAANEPIVTALHVEEQTDMDGINPTPSTDSFVRIDDEAANSQPAKTESPKQKEEETLSETKTSSSQQEQQLSAGRTSEQKMSPILSPDQSAASTEEKEGAKTSVAAIEKTETTETNVIDTAVKAEEQDMSSLNPTASTDTFVRNDDHAANLRQDSLVRIDDRATANVNTESANTESSKQEEEEALKHTSSSPSPANLSPRNKLVEHVPYRPGAVLSATTVAAAAPTTSAVPESVNLLPRDQVVSAYQQQHISPSLSPEQQISRSLSLEQQHSPMLQMEAVAARSPPSPSRQVVYSALMGGGGSPNTPSRRVVVPGVPIAHQSSNVVIQQQQAHPASFLVEQQQQQQQPATFMVQGQHPGNMRPAYDTMPSNVSYSQPGRRSIRLRLVEEDHTPSNNQDTSKQGEARRGGLRASLLGSFRKSRGRGRSMSDIGVGPTDMQNDFARQESSASVTSTISFIDRGTISVSWYDGTGSTELNEHVMRSVRRKLVLGKNATLQDVRIIDESVEPNEEIVLCPYIPDGSEFLLKFTIKDQQAQERRTFRAMDSYISEAPESPSAAPSPHPSSLDLVQLKQILTASGLVPASPSDRSSGKEIALAAANGPKAPVLNGLGEKILMKSKAKDSDKSVSFETPAKSPAKSPDDKPEPQKQGEGGGDKVQDVLRQLNDLLGVKDGTDKHRRSHRDRSEEKKQVVFVLANYFVLFLSLIVISAEIHERAPRWMDWVNTHVDSVQSCSKDSDALYKCVSEGNLAGLVASFIFWITRSAATKNILLFGFDSTQKLWTVVYEALVSAVCWGTSYIFIRRGLNPDTRRHFLHKYWKDAIYGSLAGFNAAFLKAVLKNLLPQDQVLDAFETRQLRVVGWVSHFFRASQEDF